MLIPADHQPRLPLDQLVIEEAPGGDAAELDVIFVGGGPAALSGAIALARLALASEGPLADLQIGVLEKAQRLGDHCLSGAILDPSVLRELFPEQGDAELPLCRAVDAERLYFLTRGRSLRMPLPPSLRNRGFFVASICDLVRWLGARAEELGVQIFPGFPAQSLLVEGSRVLGVRTAAAGLQRDGRPAASYLAPTDVRAQVTVLAEGSRGALAQAFQEWQQIGSLHPPLFALGVKELWHTARPLGAVVHTLGWPLPADVFGGSFFYPLAPDLAALGLVVGLDHGVQTLDVHERLQELKSHPLFAPYLRGGELVEWGAKTIPEGGFYSLPERLHGDGALLVGDSAGFVDVASLKGIHYAMRSGILAARAIFAALRAQDTSAKQLSAYDAAVHASEIRRDLHRSRNLRLAFQGGRARGMWTVALSALTGGRLPSGRIPAIADARIPLRLAPDEPLPPPDGRLRLSKADAVFYSGNDTRDDLPSHLVLPGSVSPELARFYSHLCPAGVYEEREGSLIVNPSNCIDCKATDVLGPRWTAREGGSGPRYGRM